MPWARRRCGQRRGPTRARCRGASHIRVDIADCPVCCKFRTRVLYGRSAAGRFLRFTPRPQGPPVAHLSFPPAAHRRADHATVSQDDLPAFTKFLEAAAAPAARARLPPAGGCGRRQALEADDEADDDEADEPRHCLSEAMLVQGIWPFVRYRWCDWRATRGDLALKLGDECAQILGRELRQVDVALCRALSHGRDVTGDTQ